jgi:LmbE family N-acetylglucosaminyl deacetylase
MKDIKKIFKNKKGGKLMVVFPHPDDETFATSGLLLAAKNSGWKTHVVILTKGGAGKMFLNPNGRSTKEVRYQELKKVAKLLEFDEMTVGEFEDGNLRAKSNEWFAWLKGIIKKHSPDMVVTYDISGITGHPDHIVVSVGIKKMVKAMRAGERPGLFWVTIPSDYENRFIREDVKKFMNRPHYRLKLGFDGVKKYLAIKIHKSQNLLPLTKIYKRLPFLRFEWYHKVDLNKDYSFDYVDYDI